MNTNRITAMVVAKLDLSEHAIRMLPDPWRSRATELRDGIVSSVHEATVTFLRDRPEKTDSEQECSAVSID